MSPAQYPAGPSTLTAMRNLAATGNLARMPVFLGEVAREYGPVASWRMPRGRFWFVDEPALIEQILTAGGYDVIKGRGLRRMRRLLGEGLLTSDEPLHLRQRRLVQPAFHRERVAGYAATMIEAARDAAEALADGQDVAVDAVMNRRRAAHRGGDALLGRHRRRGRRDRPGGNRRDGRVPVEHQHVCRAARLPAVAPGDAPLQQARAELDAIIYRLIEERRRDATDRGDLLSILLSTRDEDGRPMPPELVRDEALTLLLAGHETTANALTWTWDALARDPAAEARLHAELDAVLGDRDPVPADYPRLSYTRDVVAESMRLRPPAWILGRRVIRPFRLGDWESPPGSVLLTSQIVTHRNPRFWREPDAFRPERWSNGETEGLPRGAYFPFGGGNRICIGESFAWTEAVLVLATIARRVRFHALDLSPVPLQPLVTLRPGRPVRMRVEARRAEVSV